MLLVHSLQEMRQYRRQYSRSRIAFVPTMGALHAGHMSLVEEAKKAGDLVWMSIFVNPTQFGPNEDFERYPRTLEQDMALAEAAGVDGIFAPSASEVYPENFKSYLEPDPSLSSKLEGSFRPGHFRGVTTVVAKLFNMVEPDIAIFGLKDYQQWLILKKMVDDFNIPVQMVGASTYREKDGLAMSSRNQYLSEADRHLALQIYRMYEFAKTEILVQNHYDLSELSRLLAEKIVIDSTMKVDYIRFVDPNTLDTQDHFTGSTRLMFAVYIRNTRLIDNMLIQHTSP